MRGVRRFLEARPKNESFAQLHDSITADYNVSHGNKWLQVIDEHGNWLYRSPHVPAVYSTLVLPQQAPREGRYFTYVTESIHVRALIEPITVHGVAYTVQTGLTLDKTLGILTDLRAQLSVLTVIGLALSSLAGYFMSGKALSPIAAIAAEAQRINERNLNCRMPELNTRDELASLSATLNQMLARIEAGYRAVRSFTANAAHELSTPVALLQAEAEVAVAFPRDAEYYRATCDHVLKNSARMGRLIGQLLALARVDAGVQSVRFEILNLTDLLQETASEWSTRFADAGIEFTCRIGSTELWTEADYLALKRLFCILLENAWRYTPSGQSVELSLHECGRESDPSHVEVRVSDTGIGISPEDRIRIFERFYRAASPLRGDFAGSGLGLAMAQWIAKRHNTKIDLRSALGKGSSFRVRFARIFARDTASGDHSFHIGSIGQDRIPTA